MMSTEWCIWVITYRTGGEKPVRRRNQLRHRRGVAPSSRRRVQAGAEGYAVSDLLPEL